MVVRAETPSSCHAEPSQLLCTCRAGLGLVSRKNTAWQELGPTGSSAQRHPRVHTGGVLAAVPCHQPWGAVNQNVVLPRMCWKSLLGNAPPSASARGLGEPWAARHRLLGASLAHTSFVLSPSWRRKPKLSKILVMCSKSDRDSVISWEGRRAVLATIPVSPELMSMDLCSAYLFCGCLFHDISSISWLTVFIIVKFDYRTRQNHRARHVSTMQFHSKLAPSQPEDCMERGSILSLPTGKLMRNILILFGCHWEYFTCLKAC